MPSTLAFAAIRPFPLLNRNSTALLFDAFLVLAGSLLIAMMAQVAIPLPFTLVPLTGQTLAVLVVGASLGARRGTLAVAAYLAEGLIGLPVFAPGGALGIARLLGPTGGYLIGFLAAAWIVGSFAEKKWDRRFPKAWLAFFIAHTAIFIFGIAWLSQFMGLKAAIMTGYLPFLPGEVVKTALAASMTSFAWSRIEKNSN